MKLYSTREAAAYVGLSLQGFKYHVHTTKTIERQLVGHSLVFTQEQLDEFRARRERGD